MKQTFPLLHNSNRWVSISAIKEKYYRKRGAPSKTLFTYTMKHFSKSDSNQKDDRSGEKNNSNRKPNKIHTITNWLAKCMCT